MIVMVEKIFIGNRIDKAKNVVLWTTLSGVVYSFQNILFLIAIQQVLKDTAAGMYSAGFIVASQILTIAKYYVRNYQVSDINEKYSFDDYFATRIITCVIALLISIAWVFIGKFDYKTAIITVSLCIYKIAEAFSDVFEGLYQQKFRIDVSGRSQFTKDLLMVLLYIGMIVVTKNLILSTVVLAVFSVVIMLVIDIPISVKFVKWKLKFNWKNISGILVACFSLFTSSFAHAYLQQAPKYAIMNLGEDSNELLAKFNELFMPVYFFTLIVCFSIKIWLSRLTVYHQEGNRKAFVGILLKQSGIIIALMIIACVGMYFLGGFALSLIYGTDLHGYQSFHVVIMFAGAFSAWYELFECVIIIYRKQSFGLIASIFTSVVTLFIMPAIVGRYGLMGAAYGYLISNAIRAILYFAFSMLCMHRETKLKN